MRYHLNHTARNAGLVVAECAFVRVESKTTFVAPSPLGVRFGLWLAFESQDDLGGDGVPVELVVVFSGFVHCRSHTVSLMKRMRFAKFFKYFYNVSEFREIVRVLPFFTNPVTKCLLVQFGSSSTVSF